MAKRKKRKSNKKTGWSLGRFILFLAITIVTIRFGGFEYLAGLPDEQPAQAGDAPERLEIPHFKPRSGGQRVDHLGYSLLYNADYKTPYWVAWHVDKERLKGNTRRADNFLPDPAIDGPQAITSDYSRSGYDRGHMCPAGDMKWSRQAMQESFYLSNICPQNPNLNRGDWKRLEEKTRELASSHGEIFVCCGPIYNNKRPKRIGAHRVGVPDAFFKVLLIYNGKNSRASGFIYPNHAGHKKMSAYAVTIDEVESITGIDFFPALPDEIENKVESEIGLRL